MDKTVDEMLEDVLKSSNEHLIEICPSDECVLTIEQQKAKEQTINKLIDIVSLPTEFRISPFDFQHINQMMENLKIPHII